MGVPNHAIFRDDLSISTGAPGCGHGFVIVADPSIVRSISRLLQLAGHEVESFTAASQFLERGSHDGPGCIIVDLEMPAMSGMELQQALHDRASELPIIFLTAHGSIQTAVRALKSGASDFLTKPFHNEQLLSAVATALHQHREKLADAAIRRDLRSRFDSLTPREQEVCVMVGRGLLNKQIAGDLEMAEKTVKIHRARVMIKLGVESVPGLVDLLRTIGIR